MDPRNSLSDMYIFQFETLAYIENANNLNAIKTMLNGHYISKFANNFLNAGKSAKVNPVYLASLSKQEIGGATANTAVTGNEFTYDGKKYKGYYNFYNIGATSSSNPVINGLWYATGKGGKETSYNRPWNTEDKAILGGAQFIASRYISHGQSTSYFKKWNVVYNYAKANGLDANNLYTNQYMTNVQAPRSEATSTYNSYNSLGVLNDAYTFYIPVYDNMPTSTSLPKKGNPNNYLKTITLSQNSSSASQITGFKGDKYNYEINVNSSTTKATIAANTINSNASVSGTGSKNLNVGNNIWTLTVTAENGNKKTYTVNIVREASQSGTKTLTEIINDSNLNIDGNYLTGLTLNTSIDDIKTKINKASSTATLKVTKDGKEISSGKLTTCTVITVTEGSESKSYTVVLYGDINGDGVVNCTVITVTEGSESKSYTVVLYGDINGDGVVNGLDLIKVQKHILNVAKLSGASLKAADPSKDNAVNGLDLIKVQKHILGVAFINQK